MPASDICIVNANVITMDGRSVVTEALRFQDGVIVAVGKRDEALSRPGSPEIVDAGGRTILPGLIDAHAHLELLAYAWEIATDCRSTRVASVAAIVDVLREKADATPPGEWVFGQGEHYQNLKFVERRYPDRHDLDQVSERHPVMYRASYHINVFNTCALVLLGVDDTTPDAPGGRIERNADGHATGRTYDMFAALRGPQLSVASLADGIKRVQQRYLEAGVTAVGDIPVHSAGLDALITLAAAGDLRLRISAYPKLPTVIVEDDILSGRLRERLAGVDPTWLRLAGVKIFLDGGLTSGAAALYDHYPGKPGYYGELAFADQQVCEIVRIVDSAGLQIAMHAIGDRALDQAIDAIAALSAADRNVSRHRIEHAGNMFMTTERVKRMVEARIIPVPQPAFILTTAAGYIRHLGRDRIGNIMPFRILIDSGLRIPGNSDAIGITANQHHPFPAMQAAIDRRTEDGTLIGPDQALTVDEALAMYTRWGAYAIGRDQDIGSLEVGKLADFVMIDREPHMVGDLRKLQVEETWIAGQPTYVRQ
ncbi:MAG: amidohydrolase [Streptosporangiaceae bacterium]